MTSVQLLCGVINELKFCQWTHIYTIFAKTLPNTMHPASPHPNLNLNLNPTLISTLKPSLNLHDMRTSRNGWCAAIPLRQGHSSLLLLLSLIAFAWEKYDENREDAVFWGPGKSVWCPKYQRVCSAFYTPAIFYNRLVFDACLWRGAVDKVWSVWFLAERQVCLREKKNKKKKHMHW